MEISEIKKIMELHDLDAAGLERLAKMPRGAIGKILREERKISHLDIEKLTPLLSLCICSGQKTYTYGGKCAKCRKTIAR